jgi:hypothetical protein
LHAGPVAPGKVWNLARGMRSLFARAVPSTRGGPSMGSVVKTRPPGVGGPTISPPKESESTVGIRAGKSKRPRRCHLIDLEREERGEGTFGYCGARLNGDSGPGGDGRHNWRICQERGHRHCERCEAIDGATKGRWG